MINPQIRGWCDMLRDIPFTQEELNDALRKQGIDPSSVRMEIMDYGSPTSNEYSMAFVDTDFVFEKHWHGKYLMNKTIEEYVDEIELWEMSNRWYDYSRKFVFKYRVEFITGGPLRDLRLREVSQNNGDRWYDGEDGFEMHTININWSLPPELRVYSNESYVGSVRAMTYRDYVYGLAELGYRPAKESIAKSRISKIDNLL